MSRRSRKRQEAEKKEPEFAIDPFAALKAKNFRDAEPTKPAKSSKPAEPPPEAGPYDDLLRCDLIIRLEKKGRRGKTVTVIDGLPFGHDESIMLLTTALRKALATGGTLADNALELQGDQRTRAAKWLDDNGFRVRGDRGK